jgi:hypothetical protein
VTFIERWFSNQFSANFVSYLFTFATNLVPMTTKSDETAKRPRAVPTLETKLKMTVDFEAGK